MANGIIVIDKPQGWTSHDVVSKCRGILRERRIGHAGTLDPMATGVLPVFVGRATRAVEFACEAGKEYVAGLRLGLTTDTQDTTGTVLTEKPVTVTREELERALEAFRGDILQVPPMYSAVNYNGQKLYKLARKGVEVERQPRPVTIRALEVLEQVSGTDYLLRVSCSKGTYIRTLCHDLGEKLGCGGVMYSLRRTWAAGFPLEQAITIEEFQAARDRGEAESLLLPVDSYFASYPSLTVSERQAELTRHGAAFPLEGAEDGTYRVYDPEGAFLMLGRLSEGMMTAVKNFFEV